MKNLGAHYPTVTFAFLSLPLSCAPCLSLLYTSWLQLSFRT